jgi:DeoR/GlpR family transcriptional regulator of sugar metabolism
MRGVTGPGSSAQITADSAKLRQTAPVPICDYDRIDVLITDDAVTDADR